MAIQVDRTMTELQETAKELKIEPKPSGKNGKLMKEDLIIPIREHHLITKYKTLDKVPEHLKLMLNIKSPMLAKRIDSLKTELQQEIWDSEDYGLEEKLNGCRLNITKTNEGIFLYSRHNSVTDLLPIEYSNKILYPKNFNLDSIKDNFILDCELTSDATNLDTTMGKYGVVTETMLQAVTSILNCDSKRAKLIQQQEGLYLTFNVFDCIFYNGQWITNEPLKKRKALALELWDKLVKAGFKAEFVKWTNKNKKAFYKELISQGKEGAVAKHQDSIYVPDTSRSAKGWIKIKRSMSEISTLNNISDVDDAFNNTQFGNAFGDTIEGWISGFEAGNPKKGLKDYVGAIKISCYVERSDGTMYVHEIARISGFDMTLRENMTEIIDGKPQLKASYYNKVVEIDGAGVSAREHRLNHAVLLGFRYDKSKDECTIEEDFLTSQIL